MIFFLSKNAKSEKLPEDILILRERNYKIEKNVRGRCAPGFSSRTHKNWEYTSPENDSVHMLVSPGHSSPLCTNRLL